MTEAAIRFVVGGALVAGFAVLGDLFTPKSFAGNFAAAPSVALASLVLGVCQKGAPYARVEGRSMVVGAVAFLAYALAVGVFLRSRHGRPSAAALKCAVVWAGVAAAGWALWLRTS